MSEDPKDKGTKPAMTTKQIQALVSSKKSAVEKLLEDSKEKLEKSPPMTSEEAKKIAQELALEDKGWEDVGGTLTGNQAAEMQEQLAQQPEKPQVWEDRKGTLTGKDRKEFAQSKGKQPDWKNRDDTLLPNELVQKRGKLPDWKNRDDTLLPNRKVDVKKAIDKIENLKKKEYTKEFGQVKTNLGSNSPPQVDVKKAVKNIENLTSNANAKEPGKQPVAHKITPSKTPGQGRNGKGGHEK